MSAGFLPAAGDWIALDDARYTGPGTRSIEGWIMRYLAGIALSVTLFATAADVRAEVLTAPPEEVGLSSERLGRITDLFSRDIEAGVIPGAVILVARHGKVAYHEALGFRDRAAGDPMRHDAIFRIYSMTKPIFSVGAMALIEEGRMYLAEPMSKYLPAYADMSVGMPAESAANGMKLVPADQPIKIHDLLRHTSGITYAFIGAGPVKEAYKRAGLASFSLEMVNVAYADRLAELPLLWQPGTTWDYGRSTDVLGAVMEVVADAPADQFLRERIFDPLGMVDTAFWVPAAKQGRLAEPQADPTTGAVDDLIDVTRPPKMHAGGHGLVSTVADYARFCQMMLDGGVLDGTRIISRKTVEFMTADHLGDAISKDSTAYLPGPGYGFGLGFGVRTAAGESPWPGSVGEYFWGGYAGTYFWIDPAEQMVVVYMLQSVKNRNHYRMQLRNLVLQAIVD